MIVIKYQPTLSETKTYKSNGKLLFTGEYAVLDGALSLAFPTKLGQSLDIHFSKERNNTIEWLAYKNNGELWFNCILNPVNKSILHASNKDFAEKLLQIFHTTIELNTQIFKNDFGYVCETQLEFPENWGLGSSSTLINNIAKWTKVNPYHLLSKTFGGSGYDIACADAQHPIIYQLKENKPYFKEVFISSEIVDQLLFVYLNKKQNSREGIAHYRKKEKSQEFIDKISKITEQIISTSCSFENFSSLINEHEKIISKFIEIPTIKETLFSDYPGFIKSMGAWGGDFIMVEKLDFTKEYFKNKGYKVIKKYDEFLI